MSEQHLQPAAAAPTLSLSGWAVVVTRPAHQQGALVQALEARGASVVSAPTIAIAPPQDGGAQLRDATRRLASFDWVVFTSENAVEKFVAESADASRLSSVQVAAIGDGTAAALADHGVFVALLPERFVGESLVDAFPPAPAHGRVLLPRAAVARDAVPNGLRRLGWEVEVVAAYETRPARLDPVTIARVRDADAITFTSSSTVSGYLANAAAAELPPVVASIGPVTSATARAAGVFVTLEAKVHTSSGLVDALVAYATTHDRKEPTHYERHGEG